MAMSRFLGPCLLLLWPIAVPASAAGPPIHVGRVVDGSSATVDQLEALIRQELEILAHGEMELRFEDRHRLDAGWSSAGADMALRSLLEDPEVDLVIAIGLLASQRVCCLGPLPKPVVAATVLDAELQKLPRAGAASGVANLVYVDLPDGTYEELRAFYDIVPFQRLVFLASQEILTGLPELVELAGEQAARAGLETTFVPVSTSAAEALERIDAIEAAEAVYVWPLYRLTAAEFEHLVEGLIDRRLPSFSALGGREVDAGLLATRRGAGLLHRLARRVALDVQRILLGEEAGDIPVSMSGHPRLTLNMKTARRIGVEPRWETLLEARLIEDDPGVADKLDFTTMVSQVVAKNLDLAVERRVVSAAAQDIELARAAWRPQLETGVLGTLIDDDRAAASFGQQAERSWRASLGISQLLYSEDAAANVDIQLAAHAARQASYQTLRLDIAFEAGVTYLNLLRAETLQRVRRNNLELTRSNLGVAELRLEVGAASPSEVYRWQSQIAADRQALIAAAADVQQARLAVNRLMHRQLETPFSTVEVDLDSEFLFDQDKIRGLIATPRRFRLMRDFQVAEGVERSPDLAALEASLEARRRRLTAARRAFWLPTLGGQFSLDHRLHAGGAGSTANPLAGTPGDDTDWSLALSASLPLFTGGERRAEEIRASEEVLALERQIEAATERLEESIRSAMVKARSSHLGIDLARQSADAAARGQALVADAYARGTVPIIDLLDAQNATLNAELAAANAVYDFFIDLLSVERAGSWFYLLSAPAERDAWFERLRGYFEHHGVGPWRPTPFKPPSHEIPFAERPGGQP